MFDLVVNGGGPLVVRYARSGLLRAQRQVQAPWRGAVWAKDVVMIPEDGAVTAIVPGAAGAQAVQASVVSDRFGSQRATVIGSPRSWTEAGTS
jgi:hypothetical protein